MKPYAISRGLPLKQPYECGAALIPIRLVCRRRRLTCHAVVRGWLRVSPKTQPPTTTPTPCP